MPQAARRARYARPVLLMLVLLSAPLAAAAQGTPARPDSVRPDSVRPDTTVVDTARAGRAAADTAQDARRALPADPAADSVLRELRELRGFVATEYQGERAVYRADEGVLRLHGKAEVAREGDRLTADTIVYRNRVELVEAYGRPMVSGEAQELEGRVLYYDLARHRATALGARTKVTEGATWIVSGDVTVEDQARRIYASHGVFTTCDLEIPHYHFESDQIMVIRDRLLVARPARLYFGNVPVMVLPFVVQNLEQGRRSGLVVPRFSVSDIVRTSSDHVREISELGWYWAINDYMGLKLTAGWRSGAYTSLKGEYDFNWRRQFMSGAASFQRFWQESGDKQFHLRGSASWRPDERTNLGMSANFATSSRFMQDVAYDPLAVTRDMSSSLQFSRRFDWGTVALGADRQQSIANESVSGTLPSFSISPKTITFLRPRTPGEERWYNNASLQLGLNGRRSFRQGVASVYHRRQDEERLSLQGGLQSLSFGNLSINATGSLDQTVFLPFAAVDTTTDNTVQLDRRNDDRAQWQAGINYQQRLIGQTSLVPNLSVTQALKRDTLTGGEFVAAPMRINSGVSLSSTLFGFFPGIGPYSGFRHRVSPTIGYTYSPAVLQTELQRGVFGAGDASRQSRVQLSLNQTIEAKLRPRRSEPAAPAPADTAAADTVAGDTAAASAARPGAQPEQAERVTLLSITTSPITYDFALADSTGNGFVTERISNSISSDYLQGLTIRMEHELFDRRDLDPSKAENQGKLGAFRPTLSGLSTSFRLDPNSAIFRWLGLGGGSGRPAEQAAAPDTTAAGTEEESGDPAMLTPGNSAPTPRRAGGGGGRAWEASFDYSFSRAPRLFRPPTAPVRDDIVQTLQANIRMRLTENWAMTWATNYSITDGEFGSHRLNFIRQLHRWQANFSFYQTPFGNPTFQFYVELMDNRDLKFEHREGNLRVDRRR